MYYDYKITREGISKKYPSTKFLPVEMTKETILIMTYVL